MPRAARKDGNQNEIAQDLERVGLHVVDTSRLGNGFPDMVVTGYHRRANAVVAALVEVKTDKGKLTPKEEQFFQNYPDDGPLILARTSNDILRWFGAID